MAFGKRSLVPGPPEKRINVGQQHLRQALIGAEQPVVDRLG
jgi:hypothetical protein